MSDGLDSLSLLPNINWYGGLEDDWNPGEGAEYNLEKFLKQGLINYKEETSLLRNSFLDCHLYGEISPNSLV